VATRRNCGALNVLAVRLFALSYSNFTGRLQVGFKNPLENATVDSEFFWIKRQNPTKKLLELVITQNTFQVTGIRSNPTSNSEDR